MSKIIVYNLVTLYTNRRRNGKCKARLPHTAFYLLHFDGETCEVKPCGKGSHLSQQVSAKFIAVRTRFNTFVPLVLADTEDVLTSILDYPYYRKD
jgi:hypothetical protein